MQCTLRPWQKFTVAVAASLILSAFLYAVRLQSVRGAVLALGSLVCLVICVQLMGKLNSLEREEESGLL